MKYSIIITTYNCQNEIENTLEQLLSLINTDYEIIIVDDGSCDQTVRNIKKFTSNSIKLYEPGKIGRSKALNYAINKSSGEIIFINDADDISFKERFIFSIELLKREDVLVFGEAIELENVAKYSIDELHNFNTSKRANNLKYNSISPSNLYKSNHLHHSSMAVRSKTLKSLGCYDESLNVCIDLDLYLNALSNGISIYKIQETFIIRNIGETRKFAEIPSNKYIKTLLNLRKKYRRQLKPPIYYYLWDLKLFSSIPLSLIKNYLSK